MTTRQAEPYDHLFKLLLVGDAAVGKSSIMLRFTDDTFDDHLQSTIGVDFKEWKHFQGHVDQLVKMVDAGGKRIKMTIWDTAGQERFRTLTSSYYRGAQGIMLVYDVTRPETFDNLSKWLEEVETYHPGRGREVVKLLVGNKVDKERVVTRAQAEEYARSKGMLFLEASAKTKVGVKQVFEEVVQKILDNPSLLANTAPGRPRDTVDPSRPNPNQAGGGLCCG